jgi:hypothetical protein
VVERSSTLPETKAILEINIIASLIKKNNCKKSYHLDKSKREIGALEGNF